MGGVRPPLNGLDLDLLHVKSFTKTVIFVVPALVSSIRVVISMVAGLQTASFPAICY